MPALVKRTEGSSFRISGQLGMRVWPFSSKKEMNRSRMVALSSLPSSSFLAGDVSPAPLSVGGVTRLLNENAGRLPRLPAFPAAKKNNSSVLLGGASGRATRARRCSSCRTGIPLFLRFVDQLAAFHGRVVGEFLSDLLQLLRSPPELLGLLAELFARDVAALRRIQEHDDGARQRSDDESHTCSPCLSN